MDPEKVRAMIAEGRLHLNFMCSLHRRQVARGKCYLHEHPATALSWKEGPIEALMKDPYSHLVVADQCQYGLVTPSESDPNVMLPALKPTKFLTNSKAMASQLDKRCPRDHVHQPLMGGRCKDASYYPAKLVRAILKGIALQAAEGRQINQVKEEEIDQLRKIASMPMTLPKVAPAAPVAFGPPSYSSVPNLNGGKVSIKYQECNFRDKYLDEYTGEILPKHLLRAAIEDELNYFND